MPRSQQLGSGHIRKHWRVIPRTLCFVRNGDDVLLLKGAPTKRLWPNQYNGLGGHVEADEDVYTSALREVREECGLAVRDVRLRALTTIDVADPEQGILICAFTAWSDSRAVVPSEEGTLEWVPCARVAAYDLVEDLAHVLPRVLAMPDDAPPFFARYSYDAADRLVLSLTSPAAPTLTLLAAPTPYPAVNRVLAQLLAGVQSALGERFIGLYLYGSLSSGDFSPETSDVDFVVATGGPLPAEAVDRLAALHAQLGASGLKWAAKLEGAYVAQDALRRHAPEDKTEWPTLNEGHFYMATLGPDWVIQRHILRESGVVVAGPPLAPLIDPVEPDARRQAVRGLLQSWWAGMLDDPVKLERPDYQAFAILSMSRALYALRHGEIVSKPRAAEWAQSELGPARAALIARALAWRPGMPFDQLDEVLALIRYTLDASR